MVVLAALGVVGLAGGMAAADQGLRCGDTITTDTTLHENLVDCLNNGIVIGADNLTLDLNGHTIDGDGTPFSGCHPRREVCDVGVVNDGHERVTVTHGSLGGFDGGVGTGGNDNRLLDISASRNRFYGLGVFGVAGGVVRNSSGIGSLDSGGNGMILVDSDHVRVLHSSFRHNWEVGIHVADSSHNLIKGNRLSRNGAFGIILEESDRNQMRRNRSVRDGAIGIYVAPGSRNVIARNRVSRTRGAENEGVGLEVDGGDHNLFARNLVRDTAGHAISVGFDAVVGNVVRRNRIHGAGKDGVHINHKAKNTLIRHNRVRRSRDDGFDVKGRRSELTGNRAVRNGDLGIEAVRGVNDGGGNVARHNGDARQCTHVVCR